MPLRDPLDPSDLTAGKHHNPRVLRPSTLKNAPAKLGANMNRSGDLSPDKPRKDPYMLPLSAVSGYDKRFQQAARVFEAADRRAQAAKKGRRK